MPTQYFLFFLYNLRYLACQRLFNSKSHSEEHEVNRRISTILTYHFGAMYHTRCLIYIFSVAFVILVTLWISYLCPCDDVNTYIQRPKRVGQNLNPDQSDPQPVHSLLHCFAHFHLTISLSKN